jgi:Xaa-Pro dipeptidase
MRFSRRRFLQTSGIAAAGVLADPFAIVAQQPDSPAKLPEAIARLKSRKAEAKPITADERRQRLDRARQLMTANKLDAILLMSGTSLVYFSGIRWFQSERTFAMIVPAKGEPFYVCPAFEEDRAREQISGGLGSADAEVRLWQEDESPYQRIGAPSSAKASPKLLRRCRWSAARR